MGVAFSRDGRRLASTSRDGTVRLWEADTGRELRRFSGHRQMVSAVAFTPGGHAVSGSHDHTVRVWDVGSGSELYGCRGHTGAVLCVAVSPGGRTLASGGADSSIRLWQLPE